MPRVRMLGGGGYNAKGSNVGGVIMPRVRMLGGYNAKGSNAGGL